MLLRRSYSSPPSHLSTEKKTSTVLKPKAAPVLGQPFMDYHRSRGLSRKVDGSYLGYDPVPLFSHPTEEFSFEEIRAKKWLATHTLPVDEEEQQPMKVVSGNGGCKIHTSLTELVTSPPSGGQRARAGAAQATA